MAGSDGGVFTSSDACALSMVRRIAAMLDLDPFEFGWDALLPRGWHFFLMAALTRRQNLRADGFPGLGVEMPDLGLPRLLLAGRTVEYLDDIHIGSQVERRSLVRDISEKHDDKGRRAVVTIGHELYVAAGSSPAIVETQTYLLLPAGDRFQVTERPVQTIAADKTHTITPDATLLFQFSALGFNSHRIHVDRDFARDVEGYPDLVVNGGLTALLLTEFARKNLGLAPKSISIRNTAPLFSERPITLAASQEGSLWRLRAHDETGAIAADAKLEIV